MPSSDRLLGFSDILLKTLLLAKSLEDFAFGLSAQTRSQGMWSTSKSAVRTCGTLKWRVNLDEIEWQSSHEYRLGFPLRSPNFLLCGYIWRLRLYPWGCTGCPEKVLLNLTCIGTQPEHIVDYQLVLQSQDNIEKSVARERAQIMQRRRGRQHCMLSSETLCDIEKGFVKQQELIAVVHISLIAADNSTRQATGAFPSIMMASVFQLHLDDASTSDVIVKAGEVKIHAHKIILIAHSALFRAMFQSGTKEHTAEEVEMGQIEGPVLTALISFMYGRLEDIPTDIALPLFVAADAHQMLRWTCLQCLLDQVNVETVLEYAVVADAITDQVLTDACMNFILTSKDRVKIAEQPAMQELMKNNTDLAQKLWVGVMKHFISKKKADEVTD